MSELITRKRIVTVARETVTGVETFFDNIPRVLQVAQLPALVVFPGAAVLESLGSDGDALVVQEARLYELVLYVAQANLGTEGQGEIECDPYFQSMERAFLARPGLELPSEGNEQTYSCLQSTLLGDGGLQSGPYPVSGQDGPEYLQIHWQLRIEEVDSVAYRD